jgi:hypothetical protein
LIPNYDVFDEMRYFDPAKEVNSLNSGEKNLEYLFVKIYGMMRITGTKEGIILILFSVILILNATIL